MRFFVKTLPAVVAVLFAGHVLAATPEAPPREPPYTDDAEFDSVLAEDPAAQEKTTSSSYTPAYQDSVDKTPRKGVKLIKHPDAKKGLIRIEQNGTYVYRVSTTPKSKSGTFRIGFMDPPKITSADKVTDFKAMYGGDAIPVTMFDYEWQPFSKYGKLGVQIGIHFGLANGNGHFLVDGAEAPEKYTFVMVPVNLGVIYRLEYFSRQWVAPYVSGGGTYIGVAELRDDGRNQFTGTPAAYGAGGLMFNLTALDKAMAYNLDSEYGIGNLWLVAEFRVQKAFSDVLGFEGTLVSFGLGADF